MEGLHMPISVLENRAKIFATIAHGDQKRKYTGEPYTNHLQNVVDLVRSVQHTEEMLAAAWLHDTLEDTDTPLIVIYDTFGTTITSMVWYLTDTKIGPNRAWRKLNDRNRLATAHPNVKTIKLADLIDNTSSIVQYDPKFAKVYLEEKRLLIGYALTKGNRDLYELAKQSLCEAYAKLGIIA